MRIYGGVRFGGTLSIDDAWEWGFDHIAIAAGAGRPTIIDMKNNLACGIRKASDFLMALQLTGAFKRTALPNLQVRLPAIVIGGGLTAIDTATELLAYYPVQVEKTLDRYDAMVAQDRQRRSACAVHSPGTGDPAGVSGSRRRRSRGAGTCGRCRRKAGLCAIGPLMGRSIPGLSKADGGLAGLSSQP